MALRTVEHDDLVAARAAHHAGGIFPARAFDQDLHLLAHKLFIFAAADFIDQLEQTLVAFFFECRGAVST